MYYQEIMNSLINAAEEKIFDIIGAKLYKSENGFTQKDLYLKAGRNDNVCTLTLKKGSDSYNKFGELLTVRLRYNLKERQALENDINALNSDPNVKAELLVELNSNIDKKKLLKEDGINIKDIIELVVMPNFSTRNTFFSSDKREIKTLEVPFEFEGNGKDIIWIYGFLKKLKEKGVGLMPEDEFQYLAYKLILEPSNLTKEECNQLFDGNGKLCNNCVNYYYLMWREESGKINDKEEEQLAKLREERFNYRLSLIEKQLNDLGLNINTFAKKYPAQMNFLIKKIISFKDISFNTNGGYPLYMNFNSFIHIYFRHAEELNISAQFADRDKFQLDEKNILVVIRHLMTDLNEEYQVFKDQNPTGRFYRRGVKAIYFKGDYYNVDVNPDGSISTLYKGSGKQSTHN